MNKKKGSDAAAEKLLLEIEDERRRNHRCIECNVPLNQRNGQELCGPCQIPEGDRRPPSVEAQEESYYRSSYLNGRPARAT